MNKQWTLLLLLFCLTAVALASQGVVLAQAQPALTSVYRAGPLPLTEPLAPLWQEIRGISVPLTPQAGVLPALLQGSVPAVTVKSVNDGQWIAFHLTWDDATQDVSATKPDSFRDAAAIQLPVSEVLPSICMGAAGQLVNLWHWKADWQRDVDEGFRDVVDAYPNFWADFYPFVAGKPPYRMPADFQSPEARAYSVGWAAGNPLSNPTKVSPVEDLNALGFGTATSQEGQDILGRGVWNQGKWTVVFARPLVNGDAQDAQISPNKSTSLAFAVWNGSNREVGARKQVSTWTTLRVEAPRGGGAPGAGPAGAPPAASQPGGLESAYVVVAILLAVVLTALLTLFVARGWRSS